MGAGVSQDCPARILFPLSRDASAEGNLQECHGEGRGQMPINPPGRPNLVAKRSIGSTVRDQRDTPDCYGTIRISTSLAGH
jgi:hypothetical protein